MAMAGRTAGPSFGCSAQEMLGMKSSGSSGGNAATLSMTSGRGSRFWLLRLQKSQRRERGKLAGDTTGPHATRRSLLVMARLSSACARPGECACALCRALRERRELEKGRSCFI